MKQAEWKRMTNYHALCGALVKQIEAMEKTVLYLGKQPNEGSVRLYLQRKDGIGRRNYETVDIEVPAYIVANSVLPLLQEELAKMKADFAAMPPATCATKIGGEA